MPYLQSGEVRLYAERRGEGSPLLFIGGTGSDLAVPPTGFDLSFAASHDTACYDHRGLGRSDRPSPSANWSMADYGDDAAAVLDWAGWDTAAVVGVSFGGMVAQELLIRHPDRVSRAALVCTSSGGEGGASYPLQELVDLPPEDYISAFLPILDTRWSDPATNDPLREYLVTALSKRPPPDDGARAQLEVRRQHDTWQRLREVKVPVLVSAGRYDGIAPLANSQAIVSQIPGSRLEVYDGGHGFLYQDPSSVRDIASFLAA